MRIEVQVFYLGSVETQREQKILDIVKEKMYHIHVFKKRTGMATLLSNKVKFRMKEMTRG